MYVCVCVMFGGVCRIIDKYTCVYMSVWVCTLLCLYSDPQILRYVSELHNL